MPRLAGELQRTEQWLKNPLPHADLYGIRGYLVKSLYSFRFDQALFGILLLSPLFAPLATAQTHDYYVSPTGSDSNPGTQAQPWRTINHAATAETLGASGTVIHVAPGTYAETGTSQACVQTTSSGASNSRRLVFQSDTLYGAVLTCSGKNSVWELGVNGDPTQGQYVDITGFALTGSTCQGVWLTGSHSRFIHNKVYDIAGCPEPGGGAGIATGGVAPLTDITIDGNIVDNVSTYTSSVCPGDHGIYPSTDHVIIINNIVSRACGWGIQQFHATSTGVISNNTVFNNLGGGILVTAKPSQTTSDSNSVINNLVVNNAGHNGIEEAYGATGPNNVYRNNLMIGNSPSNFAFGNGSRITTGNICSSSGTGCQSTTAQGVSGIFVNYTGSAVTGDYHLKAGSVAIGASTTAPCATGGISPCVPGADLDGNPRPQGSAYDIGAYEYGATRGVLPPTGLTATVN